MLMVGVEWVKELGGKATSLSQTFIQEKLSEKPTKRSPQIQKKKKKNKCKTEYAAVIMNLNGSVPTLNPPSI